MSYQTASPLEAKARPRHSKFTPERIQQIKDLVVRGETCQQIAAIIGVTVGTLKVTCSRLGISLRRPKIDNGVCLPRKRTALCENASHAGDHDARVPLQPTEEQSQGNSQSDPALIVKPQQERANTPVAACFAIRFQYRGMERMDELPLAPHTMGRLALEAALREVEIGQFIAEIITAMVNKGLFPLVLDHSDPATDRVAAEELS
jgi:hypothetical protein